MVWTISTESELTQQPRQIPDFWQRNVVTGMVSAKDDIPLAYAWCVPKSAKATVVISSGRIEAYLKYQEVVFDLYRNGFAVFIMDHRGQGLSGRMTDNPHQGYVSDFNDYVDDLHRFVSHVVMPHAPDGPRYLLGHSMGCAIGALTLLRFPDLFQKVVFCSPMFGIRPALPNWLAHSLLRVVSRRHAKAGIPAGYFIGQNDYRPPAFEANRLTHSALRYQLFRTLYADKPEIQLGGVTVHWLRAAIKAMDIIERQSSQLKQPCLLLSAGADTVVDNRRQKRVVSSMPNVVFETFKGAYHELLIEEDAIRQPVMQRILDFLV